MQNQYYKFIVQKILTLKQKGYFSNIEVHDSFVDPQLDILLKSFSYIVDEIDQIIQDCQSNIKLSTLRLHYDFLLRSIPSKMIILPHVNFEQPFMMVDKNSKFQAYEKEQTYFYRNCYTAKLLPIDSLSSKTYHADDLNINHEFGDYFIKLNLKFLRGFNIKKCNINSLRIMFYKNEMKEVNKLLLSMSRSNKAVYKLVKGDVIKIGHIKTVEVEDMEDIQDAPVFIQALINYFQFNSSYYIFDIVFEENLEDIENEEDITLLISINKYIKSSDFILFNFLILTNLDDVQSNMFYMKDSLKTHTFLDYITRHVNKIYHIKHMYAFDVQESKKYSVQNFVHYDYDRRYPPLECIYWLHHKKFANNSYKDYISLDTLKYNLDFLYEKQDKMQYYYTASSYQVINRKLNIDKILCTTNNKVLLKSIIFGPTFSKEICLDNIQVLDNLFTIYNPDIIHTNNKRGIILNILNSMSYIFQNYVNFDDIIYDVKIKYEFIESVINGQYTSNVMLYKIMIIIGDENAVGYDFYASLSQFFLGLFGISIETHVVFYDLLQNRIIYDEYSTV